MDESSLGIGEIYYSPQAVSIVGVSNDEDGVRLFQRTRARGDYVELPLPPGASLVLDAKIAHRAPILIAVIGSHATGPLRSSLWCFDLLGERWTQIHLQEFSADKNPMWPVRVSSVSDYGISADLIVGAEDDARHYLCRVDLVALKMSHLIELNGTRGSWARVAVARRQQT